MKIKLKSCRSSYNYHLFSLRNRDFWLVLVRVTANYEERSKNSYSINIVCYDEKGTRKVIWGDLT